MRLNDVCKFLLKTFRLIFGLFALAATVIAFWYGNSPMAIAWGLILYFHLRLIHLEKDRETMANDLVQFVSKKIEK